MTHDADGREPLVIRAPQIVALLEARDPTLAEFAAQLARRHPDGLHGRAPRQYDEALRTLASRMVQRYGVLDSGHLLRLFAIAEQRGWDFDHGDAAAWVRQILLDPRTPRPGRRVERLEAELRERDAIEARNRAIDAALSGRMPRRGS